MARQANQVIVLTESDKFSKHGIVPLNLKGQVKRVITDTDIPDPIRAELNSKDVLVTVS